jgi:hypothetical protein
MRPLGAAGDAMILCVHPQSQLKQVSIPFGRLTQRDLLSFKDSAHNPLN